MGQFESADYENMMLINRLPSRPDSNGNQPTTRQTPPSLNPDRTANKHNPSQNGARSITSHPAPGAWGVGLTLQETKKQSNPDAINARNTAIRETTLLMEFVAFESALFVMTSSSIPRRFPYVCDESCNAK